MKLTARICPFATVLGLDEILTRLSKNNLPFSPEMVMDLDHGDMFPEAACDALNGFGLQNFYVPKQYGGDLHSYEELMQLWRTVARRDLTIAVAHEKTFLGAICIWLAGTGEQAHQLAADIINGCVVSWGLTERNHGSDLLAGSVTAKMTAAGWVIDGEKWLINNATRGHKICVLARTSSIHSTRNFSLFLVDKNQLTTDSYHYLPKEQTYGVRGADISGIVFKNATIAQHSLVGKEGEGIEVVLKALQLTRTLCAGLSLGAADQALKFVTKFSKQDVLYDKKVIDIPFVKKKLGKIFTAYLIVEAVSIAASRSIHVLTKEMSVISSIAKSMIPEMVDEIINEANDILNLKSSLNIGITYLDDLFKKVERDHRLISIFDGSTVVNRNILINHFNTLSKKYTNQSFNEEHMDYLFNLQNKLEDFNARNLSLFSSNGCSILQSFVSVHEQILNLVKNGNVPKIFVSYMEKLKKSIIKVVEKMEKYKPSPLNVTLKDFDLAISYEICFSAVVCLQLWLKNDKYHAADYVDKTEKNCLWIDAVMIFILNRLNHKINVNEENVYMSLVDKFVTTTDDDNCSLLFKILDGDHYA